MMIISNSLGRAMSDQYYYLISIYYLKVLKKAMCEILRVFPHKDVFQALSYHFSSSGKLLTSLTA